MNFRGILGLVGLVVLLVILVACEQEYGMEPKEGSGVPRKEKFRHVYTQQIESVGWFSLVEISGECLVTWHSNYSRAGGMAKLELSSCRNP
jgi:hypothetical protein